MLNNNQEPKEPNMNKTDNITLLRGDCLEILPTLADNSIDAVICDLPYGTTSCKWDVVIPFAPLWEQLNRVCKDAVVLFASEPFTSALIASNYNAFKEKLTWVKHKPSNIGNARIRHLKYSEDIVVFANGRYTFNPQYTERKSDRVRQAQKGNSKQWRTNKKPTQEVSFATEYAPRDWHTFDADRKLQGNVITIPSVVSNSKEKVNHPTQKPVTLLEYLIKAYTNEGDCVLDCTMGSGSTLVACVNPNRRGIGIELMQEYYDIAVKRVKDAQAQLKLDLTL